jgi:sterol desaturase/sphingolipid hydroxylase (fatty acid hydroxylase superfamily)
MITVNKFFTLAGTTLAFGHSRDWEVEYSFKTEDLPSTFTILWQVIFCFVIEDFLFHLTHRLMHHKFFYCRFHKLHH